MQHASVINMYEVFIKLVELLKRQNISSFKFSERISVYTITTLFFLRSEFLSTRAPRPFKILNCLDKNRVSADLLSKKWTSLPFFII